MPNTARITKHERNKIVINNATMHMVTGI